MPTSNFRHFLHACITIAFATSAMAVGVAPIAEVRSDMATRSAVIDPPLENWVAPQYFNAPHGAFSSDGSFGSQGTIAKAARTLATFIPVAPCRLVDTRGAFNPVYAGGPFAAGEARVYQAAGHCGIPAGSNRILAVSVAVTTLPTPASGDVEVIANGVPLGNTVLMVVQAGLWNSATTSTGVDSAGNFQVQVRSTPASMAIDINGYYAQLDPSNTTDYFSIIGNYDLDGGLLNVNETGVTGAAIRGVNASADVRLAQGLNAIDIASGGFRVRGAGVNTDTMAFVHQTTAADICDGTTAGVDGHFSRIENSQTFDPTGTLDLSGLILFVQQRGETPSKSVAVTYRASSKCTSASQSGNGWFLYNSASAFVAGESYNVMVIRP